MIGILSEYEIKDCFLFGLHITPRFAYVSREDWYDYLKTFNHPKLEKAFSHLEKHNKNGLNYKWLSDHLYKRLIEKCTFNQP